MTEQSKPSVPSTIGGGSPNGDRNNNNNNNNANGSGNDNNQGRCGNFRRRKGNGRGHTKSDIYDSSAPESDIYDSSAPIPCAFKDDYVNTLGAMHQHYFDCYDNLDQVCFNITLEKLQQYVSENYRTFGRAISARIADSSKRPTVPDVQMPEKKDKTTGKMADKESDELSYGEKKILIKRFKMSIQL
jgi:hypothetical protein